MKIAFESVLVDDQSKAHVFYTTKMGFVTKIDMPMGADIRWLTLVSPQDPDGTQLLLEPDWNPPVKDAVKAFKEALVDHRIPATAFQVDDVRKEYDRMSALGVTFTQPPTPMGPVIQATLDDTCGNLIQIFQMA